jgi:hypothetical protein
LVRIYDALKVAVEFLESQGLMYRDQYQLTASRLDDEWVFWFVFLPKTPGLDITVYVPDAGQPRFLAGI